MISATPARAAGAEMSVWAEDVGSALGGAAQHGRPEAVGVAELVLHGSPGRSDLLGDTVGRHGPGIAGSQRRQGSLEQVLPGGIARAGWCAAR